MVLEPPPLDRLTHSWYTLFSFISHIPTKVPEYHCKVLHMLVTTVRTKYNFLHRQTTKDASVESGWNVALLWKKMWSTWQAWAILWIKLSCKQAFKMLQSPWLRMKTNTFIFTYYNKIDNKHKKNKHYLKQCHTSAEGTRRRAGSVIYIIVEISQCHPIPWPLMYLS